MNTNPFQKLIVDEAQEADMQQLADLLQPHVVFVKSSKSMDFSPEFQKLSNELRILVALAASKAKATIFSQEENMSQKNIIDLDIAPEGSIKATLKKLFDKKEIKSKDKKYFLPSYRISALADKLKKHHSSNDN